MPAPALYIVADENIPLVREAFGAYGTISLLPGRQITREAVREADVLLVRSVTQVDAGLVADSALRFVGSATIGTDHVDAVALRDRGIAFVHAPGSNAVSVVEYVLAALLHLAVRKGEALRGKTAGLVGCGNIGGRLAVRLPALGMRVLKNDPPLAEGAGPGHGFAPLEAVLAEADVVTLHVPLTRAGTHATHHLFDETVLRRMKPGAWLLNTARGSVVDNAALKALLADGRLGAAVLDVWEGEPTPDPGLLRRVDLATPHIAGYSYDGKLQGTIMLYHALIEHLDLPPRWDAEAALAPSPEDRLALTPPADALAEAAWLDALTRQMYDLPADDARMRRLLPLPPHAHADYFTGLRKGYPRRRAFHRHTLRRSGVPEDRRAAVEEGLQVRLVDD